MEADELTARLLSDMDPELLEFIKARVNSFIKWDLIRFFYENPHTTDTAENIARYAGRNALAVKPELEELVSSGILRKPLVGGMPVYSLTDDSGTREVIRRFVQASEDRHFRVKAVYHIVKGMH
jgi:hypothetical protein